MFTDLMLCQVMFFAEGDTGERCFCLMAAWLHLSFDLPTWEHVQVSGFNMAVRSTSKTRLVVNVDVPEF